MKTPTNLADLVGLEHTKLGFFKEVQVKIEELRRSNTELERKRREIQAILDGITDVMAVVSLDYRIVSVNQVFFKSFPHADPTGAFCYHVFRGSDRPCSPCPLLTARRDQPRLQADAHFFCRGAKPPVRSHGLAPERCQRQPQQHPDRKARRHPGKAVPGQVLPCGKKWPPSACWPQASLGVMKIPLFRAHFFCQDLFLFLGGRWSVVEQPRQIRIAPLLFRTGRSHWYGALPNTEH